MEDLISRQTVIDGLEFVIEHGIETDGAHSISAEKMLEFVRELPTVQPEPHWIPISERLPDNSRNVLITHKGGVSMGWYNGLYFEKGASTYHRKMKTVTAWCELPEPYKGATT